MRDLRQTDSYSKYMQGLGWKVGKADGVYYYLKHIPVIGCVIKIQRAEKLVPISFLKSITKKNRAFMLIMEPKEKFQADYYVDNWGFKKVKSPSLPSKTLRFDLRRTEKELLGQMHHKARYNINLSKRRGVRLKKSDDINLFANFWQSCAKKRGMYLSQKREIKAIHKAHGKNAQLLLAYLKKELLAGVLLINTDEISYYMYAASSDKGNKLFAPSILVWEAIRYSKKRGSRIFDFEGIYDERYPLKSWRGFSQFKRRFGGTEVEFPGSITKYYLPI